MENNARQQIKNTHGQSSGDGWVRVRNPWKLATHYALEAASMADQLAEAVEQTAKAAIREAGELGTAAGGALASLSTEQLGRNLQRHVRRIRRILFSTIVVFCVYVALGALFFWYVEGWTVADSAYFAVVSISTVGYGDLSPGSEPSRVFTVFYIFVGIIFVFGKVAMRACLVLQHANPARQNSAVLCCQALRPAVLIRQWSANASLRSAKQVANCSRTSFPSRKCRYTETALLTSEGAKEG